MSFFEPPPPPPEPPVPEQPVWSGPPDNEPGVAVPLRVLLARTDEVAVAVLGLAAFSTGFELHGTVRVRDADHDLHESFVWHRLRHGPELPPEVFRFGVRFADDRRATNVGFSFPRADEEPEGPVLMPRGGGGGGRSWQLNWWIWPLPPPGPLQVVCEWPARGIELTRYELDAATILDAAARSEQLWPDGGPEAGGGWVTSRRIG